MKYIYLLLFTILYSNVTLSANANESHDHKGADHEEVSSDNDTDDHELRNEDSTEIANVIAQQVGIQLDLTGPQTLEKTFTSYGRLATAPEHTSHVRARFPGVVRSVSVNIGDKVDVGDLLAIIESNESLKRYELLAPISGTIIQRHANAGR